MGNRHLAEDRFILYFSSIKYLSILSLDIFCSNLPNNKQSYILKFIPDAIAYADPPITLIDLVL